MSELLIKGGYSKKHIFGNANKNLALSLATHGSFSLLSAGFPCEICLQSSNIVAAILNSIQQPGCIFVTSFRVNGILKVDLSRRISSG